MACHQDNSQTKWSRTISSHLQTCLNFCWRKVQMAACTLLRMSIVTRSTWQIWISKVASSNKIRIRQSRRKKALLRRITYSKRWSWRTRPKIWELAKWVPKTLNWTSKHHCLKRFRRVELMESKEMIVIHQHLKETQTKIWHQAAVSKKLKRVSMAQFKKYNGTQWANQLINSTT